jgi:hypothetical protein
MDSIFKMAILCLSVRPSESCIIAIFRPAIFKLRTLVEDYNRINDTFGFIDSLSISSEIVFLN